MQNEIELIHKEHYWLGKFTSMASPCEVLIECNSKDQALALTQIAYDECHRIEHKFSRYRSDNIIYQINSHPDQKNKVDPETALLMEYAQQCFNMSDGLFDITSGAFRSIWHFTTNAKLPTQAKIDEVLKLVGWNKIYWKAPYLRLNQEMQIDLGGIGKEYAVDRTMQLISKQTSRSVMLNFGGDCSVNTPRKNQKPWVTGIENPISAISKDPIEVLNLYSGALATSGDTNKYLIHDHIRYGHIINPITGWAVSNAPHSVTIAAPRCIDAGVLSTISILKELQAEDFLQSQSIKYWCQR